MTLSHSDQTQDAFPWRSDYAAPPRPDSLPLTRPTAAEASFDGSPADVAHQTLLHADGAFQRYLSTIDPTLYSPAGLAKQIGSWTDTDAYQAVAPSVAAVVADADAADDDADEARAAVSEADTASSAADELRAQRVWSRAKGLLDAATSGGPLHDAAVRLVMNASPVDLPVLVSELSPYLQARGQASTSWIDAAVRSVAPEYASAVAISDRSQAVKDIVAGNAAKLDKAISNTVTPGGYHRPFFVDPKAALGNNTIVRNQGTATRDS